MCWTVGVQNQDHKFGRYVYFIPCKYTVYAKLTQTQGYILNTVFHFHFIIISITCQ